MSTEALQGEADDVATEYGIVDCDVHVTYNSDEALTEHLPPRYRDRGLTLSMGSYTNPNGFVRTDTIPNDGGRPASSPENTREHLLDRHDIEFGIITGNTRALGLCTIPNRDYAAELARAHNEWVARRWLPSDDRFLASIVVAPQNPDRSVELIEEYADHDQFVQVIMGSASRDSYGHPQYWPIYEAAVDYDLPVAIHPANFGAGLSPAPSASGYPSTYFEWHNAASQHCMGQLNSVIIEGVFVEYPDLMFVCVEGGFGWLPHLMWRMDKNWKSLRDQAPWLDRRPSEYVIDNVRITSQPIEEPEKPEHLLQLFEMMHADRTLLFASDYPHWDADDPDHGFPRMSDDLRRRIMYENAADLYDLPSV